MSVTRGHDPANGVNSVPIDTNIVVHIQDDGDGVDQATIAMTVDGVAVTPVISGLPADYTLTYDPETDFGYLQAVDVTVDADDLAGNSMTTDAYSFTTQEEPDTTNPYSSNSVLVNYQRSGGFVGLRDQLTIYFNGRCQLQRKGVEREFTIQPDQLAHLQRLMQEANLIDLKEEYIPTNLGADYFEYIISYQLEEGRIHRIRTVTGSIPDTLQPILTELDNLISNNGWIDNMEWE